MPSSDVVFPFRFPPAHSFEMDVLMSLTLTRVLLHFGDTELQVLCIFKCLPHMEAVQCISLKCLELDPQISVVLLYSEQ